MNYQVFFPSVSIEKKFGQVLSQIPQKKIRQEIMRHVESLAGNPRPFEGKLFKKLKPPVALYQLTAQYRLRVGDYRILYDVDDSQRKVWILALRRRSEKTYQ